MWLFFKRLSLLGMLCNMFLMTGCDPFVENNTIEEISPVIFWSINTGEEGKLKISTLVPPVIKETKRLLSLQVDLFKQGGEKFNLIYYRELKRGQTRMVLINEELARKGVISIINTLLVDPEISQRLYLVIVRGNFDDYMQNQIKTQPDLDYFFYRMLKHYEKYNQGEMSIMNLHQFKSTLYSPFPYPILPVFKVNSDNFSYLGTAMFDQDKLIGTIKQMDDQIFQLLNNDHYLKFLPIPKLATTLGYIHSDVHKKLDRTYSTLSIQIDITGIVEEYRGDKNIIEQEQFYQLRDDIEHYLEQQTTDLLKKMQQYKVDPLQFGNLTLSPFARPMSKGKWMDYWQNMEINVDYNVRLAPLSNVQK
ncbi:Ger(x)C family spore germination C-terminal domain-containing protein [Paenibacillus sediminis]|uniref:Spore germination protein n=1 Tax=Paenibacillus sediminis TaxID=664909 RepID=A0ABS4H158_9BACL|nr:Ger(x)C family spore germination C-terminal domain-containing protein [Paenibacillus sediminis]MBP1936259.1 spore germination protein [Paenibacillus sediminis]